MFFLACYSTLKMYAIRSSETSGIQMTVLLTVTAVSTSNSTRRDNMCKYFNGTKILQFTFREKRKGFTPIVTPEYQRQMWNDGSET
jgi:hypothetical protein